MIRLESFVSLALSRGPIWFIGVCLAGLIIGVLGGLFGIGGGFLLTLVLRTLFDLPYPVAVESILLLIFLNSLIASFRHWRNGNVEPRLGLILALPALGGAGVGIRLELLMRQSKPIPFLGGAYPFLDLFLSLLFLVLLGAVAISIVFETGHASGGNTTEAPVSKRLCALGLPPFLRVSKGSAQRISLWFLLLIGFMLWVLTGLMGVGGGFVNLPLLIYLIGLPTHVAVGTGALQILLLSGFGALRHGLVGDMDLFVVGALFVTSVLGLQIGVVASKRIAARSLRRFFVIPIIAGMPVILWGFVRETIPGCESLQSSVRTPQSVVMQWIQP